MGQSRIQGDQRRVNQFGHRNVRGVVAAQLVAQCPYPARQRRVGPQLDVRIDHCPVGRCRSIDKQQACAQLPPQRVGDLERQELRRRQDMPGEPARYPPTGGTLVDQQGHHRGCVHDEGSTSDRGGQSAQRRSASTASRMSATGISVVAVCGRTRLISSSILLAASVSSASRYSCSDRPEPAARAARMFRTCSGTLRMVIAPVMRLFWLHRPLSAADHPKNPIRTRDRQTRPGSPSSPHLSARSPPGPRG